MAQIEEKHVNGQGLGKDTDRSRLKLLMTGVSVAAVLIGAGPAPAQPNGPPAQTATEEARIAFDIPAQPLESAVTAFGFQARYQVAVDQATLTGLKSNRVRGNFTPAEALSLLLAGTGITYRLIDENSVTLVAASPGGTDDGSIQLDPITVEGTTEGPPPSLDPVEGYRADYATTGTRIRLPIEENPSSIGVVTDDLIEDTVSRTKGDALEGVSGVSRQVRIGRSEFLTIRGFSSGVFNSATSSLKENGLPANADFALDPALIERYEVLKGPASIVGGASSPGGVINRITKTPQTENFAIFEGQGGSFGLKRGVADLNGVAFENQRLRGRLIAAAEDGGDFVDDVDSRQTTVAPSIEGDLFDGAATLRIIGRYQNFDGASYLGFPLLENGEVPDISPTTNIGGGESNGAFTEYTSGSAQIQYEHAFLDRLTLSAKAGFEQSDLEELDVYSYRYGGIPLSGDTYIYAGFRDTETETYAGEIYLSKAFTALGQDHEVLIGADYRDQAQTFLSGYQYLGIDNIFNLQNNFQAPPINEIVGTPLFNRDIRLQQTGLFGQLVIRPFDRLTLVAAGRQDWAEIKNLNKNTDTTLREDPTAFTARVGATFEVTPWLNIYGGYQESFEPNATAVTVDDELLPSETGQSYEAGAKVNAFDGRFSGTLALFRTFRQNVATTDPANPRFSIADGEQRNQGIELDVNGAPIPGLQLSASFAYVDAEVTESNAGTEGNSPFGAPVDYFGRVWGTYTFQSGPLRNFGFGGGVYFTNGNHLDATGTLTSDGYERVDLVAFYRPLDNVELRLNVRNLTDATYIEAPRDINGFNQFGAPRSIFGTLTVRF